MTWDVVAEIPGRFDDRLCPWPGGFASATGRAITRWRVAADGSATEDGSLVSDEEHPGPLAPGPDGTLAWGPTLVDPGTGQVQWPIAPLVAAATADLGSDAHRRYRLVAGAVDRTGTRVALALRRVEPRTVASRTPAMPPVRARLAVVTADGARVEGVLDGTTSVDCLAWDADHLLAGRIGGVDVYDTSTSVVATLDLDEGATPVESLAVVPGGAMSAGTASGSIVRWPSVGDLPVATEHAHAGSVTALVAPDPDRLISGGHDGWIRGWAAGELVDEHGTGQTVDAVSPLGDPDGPRLLSGGVVAKIAGQGGSLLIIRG